MTDSESTVQALPGTGERFLPDFKDETVAEHLHRYSLAQQFCEHGDVLDIASGEGYGSHLLSLKARSVVGIDISPDAVAHAAAKYKRENLCYRVGSATEIPVATASVDVAVSFETIEHHTQHDEMVRELRRVLRPEGLLIISTPDKLNYTDRRGIQNKYHVMELYQQDFRDLICRHFEHVQLLVQRTVFGSVITPESGATFFESVTGDYQGFERQKGLTGPMYSICIASSAPLPEAKTTIFGSRIEYSYAMQDKLENISILEQRLRNQAATIASIERSLSFRLGRMMTAPVRWLLRK